MKKLLDERIALAIEGFKRGGVVLTRRDVLEMYKQSPQTVGAMMPFILEELAQWESKASDEVRG